MYPDLSDLEIGLIDEVYFRIFPQLNTYFGYLFEELILEQIKQKTIPIPFSFTEVRRWWHRDKEIDILVLNGETREILFCECKWQNRVNAKRVLNELKEKAKFVNWNKSNRKEFYCIIVKSFSKKVDGCLLFDLNDLGDDSLKNHCNNHSNLGS